MSRPPHVRRDRCGFFRAATHAARRAAGAALAAVAIASASGPAAGANLVPHRASYEMSRKSSSIESDVAGVTGQMRLDLAVSCDGWRVEQFLGFRIFDGEGGVLEHLAHLSGFETRDGRDYWFNTKSYENRQLVEELSGVARLDPPAATGTVRLAKPEPATIDLPPRGLFPTSHVAALVDVASRGGHRLVRPVYDGSSLDSPFEVSAVIGAARTEKGSAFPGLAGQRAWPVQLAYYPVRAVEPEPDFQMSIVLYENGIAGDMVYDYGSFTVSVTLRELEILPNPDCPK